MKYYLGLDLGTNSVGWAVTDTNYEIARKKGRDLWGIREFQRAETAATRRTNRVSRRRLAREKARIGLLKSLFADAIEKVDPNFYERLENSRLYIEDKSDKVKSPNGIFDDCDYSDKDYYREFPTIYHLRKELIENKAEKYDVRLVFLALLNMFKHRGHFLNATISGDDTEVGGKEIYEAVVNILESEYGIYLKSGCYDEIQTILSDSSLSRSSKQEKIIEVWKITKKDKVAYECSKLICGLNTNLKTIFNEIESEGKVEICFDDLGYEEKLLALRDYVDDEAYSVIVAFKQIYDDGILAGIMQNHKYKYISEAKVGSYEKHKKDLALLKSIYAKYTDKDSYTNMFRSEEKGSYSAYVNSFNSGKKMRRDVGDRKNDYRLDNLYSRIKRDIPESLKETDEDVAVLFNEMEKRTFLPKQLISDNGVIPNQVYLKEMSKILENAKGYLPFLTEKDEKGITVSEKILMLFKFQIPYYIGPVSEKSARDGGNGWVVRKESGPVLPWNYEEKIDISVTAQAFIERMLRNCTYIAGEKAMPRSSLEYEAYCVLNEINNIRISGERITVQLKQDIFRDLFLSGEKVTRSKLEKYLHGRGFEISQISGIDTDLNHYLSSYGKFYGIFGDEIKLDKCRRMVEDIIYLSTVFGDAKRMLRKQIEEKYGDIITPEQIKKIIGMKFRDWGRFSKVFLELQGCDKSTGEITSIIRTLWETQCNLMELINSDEYTFKEELVRLQNNSLSSLSEMTYDDLDDYYFSNPVKRIIWQTILVIRDIEKIMGGVPERIFIEMTRSDEQKGDKGRKDSRKKQLQSLYKNIKDDEHNWIQDIEDADKSGLLRSKKIYLYYTQMGKCMYTGESIDLDNLLSANSNYDIDHIYPRHFVKDDNIGNNLVLVKKESNAYKSDNYPVLNEVRSNPAIKAQWKMLLDKKLITNEKYRRLTGNEPFTDEQRAGFIARQLVETSQGMKGVADILKEVLPDTTIVYSKGRNVSEFRKDSTLKNNFLKSRLVNEFHHAQDAYLNIVVGNVYYTKFTQNPLNYIKNEFNKDTNNYNLNKMFANDITRNGYCAWKAPRENKPGTNETVRRMLSKNTPIMTRLSYEEKGELFNVTLYGKDKAKEDNYVPAKKGLPVLKYGGYTSLKPAYFIFVEYGSDKKRQNAFDVVHTYYASSIKNEKDLLHYCTDVLNMENPRIIVAKIKKYSLIKMDGYFLYITGMDGRKNIELHNAVNLCMSIDDTNYIHDLEVSVENIRLKDTITKEKNLMLYEKLLKKHKNTIFNKSPKPMDKILMTGEEAFSGLDTMEQCKTLIKIIKISGIETESVNIKEINGPTEAGRIRISGNMTKKKELLLINQSASGLFSTSKDLLNS